MSVFKPQAAHPEDVVKHDLSKMTCEAWRWTKGLQSGRWFHTDQGAYDRRRRVAFVFSPEFCERILPKDVLLHQPIEEAGQYLRMVHHEPKLRLCRLCA